jgi:rhamnose utilization protein RhaD (predicted bifunctional aldolase and dehydrogenase)
MENNLDELVRISHLYGQDPEFVIAGGGNTSFKNVEKIWVKSSGSSMANVRTEDFVCLDRKKIQVISVKTYNHNITIREEQVREDLNAAILSPKDRRPSVETSMHEMIRYSFVVHTHPTIVNGLLCASNSKSIVSQLFGNDVLYIEYTDPGYSLFKKVDIALNRYRLKNGKDPGIIFLENHGVFVAANSTREVEEIYANVILKIAYKIAVNPNTFQEQDTSVLRHFTEKLKSSAEFTSLVIVPFSNELIQQFIVDEASFCQFARPLTPDNIVYCKSNYLYVSEGENIPKKFNAFINKFGYYPKVIGIQEKGILTVEEDQHAAQTVLDVFYDMMKVCYITKNFGGPRFMSQKQIAFIDSWEAENYRRQIHKENK